jgi:hypothetical protein
LRSAFEAIVTDGRIGEVNVGLAAEIHENLQRLATLLGLPEQENQAEYDVQQQDEKSRAAHFNVNMQFLGFILPWPFLLAMNLRMSNPVERNQPINKERTVRAAA